MGRTIDSSYYYANKNVNIEILRVLLLLESLLRTSLLQPEVYENALGNQLTLLASEVNTNISSAVVLKSKKILLIIQGLIKYLEE